MFCLISRNFECSAHRFAACSPNRNFHFIRSTHPNKVQSSTQLDEKGKTIWISMIFYTRQTFLHRLAAFPALFLRNFCYSLCQIRGPFHLEILGIHICWVQLQQQIKFHMLCAEILFIFKIFFLVFQFHLLCEWTMKSLRIFSFSNKLRSFVLFEFSLGTKCII